LTIPVIRRIVNLRVKINEYNKDGILPKEKA